MTALFSTRRRADQFAAALDDGSHAARSTRDLDRELRELVGVATSLRSPDLRDGAAVPREEFASDLRSRLMTEAEQVLTPGTAQLLLPARTRGRRERRLVAAASAVVLLGGSAGMAAAAQQALPGEALYPIKRGIERAQAGLSMSPGGKGIDLLQQANDRLSEIEGLLADDRVSAEPQVPATLEDFTAQAEQGAELLMADYRETRDPRSIAEIREFTTHGIEALRELARTAPPEATDELAAAAVTLQEIDTAATGLCGTCAPGVPALQMPDLFLMAADVNRTLDGLDPARLDNSHPVEVDERLVARADELADGAKKPAGSPDGKGGQTDGTPADAPDAPGAPDGPALPGGGDVTDGRGGVLEQLGQGSDADSGSGPVEDTVGAVEDTVEDVTDGLSGVVETILPDPESDGGLLP